MNWNIFQSQSLKTRITLFTLAIFVVSIWSLAFFVSKALRDDMQRLLGEQVFSTVSIVAAQIEDELSIRVNALEIAATKITPKTMASVSATQAFLEDRLAFQSLFNAGTFVTGIDGTATASLPRSAERRGVNYMERDHIVSALKEGKSKISKPVIGKTLGVPVFSIGVPIRDPQGKVIGALVGVTDLSQPSFLGKITNNKYGKSGGYVLMAPRHWLIVSSTDKTRIMKDLPRRGINPLSDRYADGYEGYGTTIDSLGVEVLSAAKKIPVADWVLVARISAAEAFAPVRGMQQRMLVATILLTLIAGVLTGWMLRRQLAPVMAAAKALAALSATNQSPQPLPIARQDEVGNLIGGFNRLLDALGKREERLMESEERFHRVFEEGPLGMAMVSIGSGKFMAVNAAFCRMLGYTEEELEGMSFKDVTDPEHLEKDMDEVKRLWAGQIPKYNTEKRYITKNGATVSGALTASVIHGKDGKPLYTLAMIEDITKRVQSEAARTLLEAKLHESQKMEALGTLAGGVAHDFNNALAAIIGNVELARQDLGQDHPALESLEEIAKASRRSKHLVQQILAFARRQKVERRPVSLALVVLESAHLLRASLPAKVSLNVDCKADTPAVLADATQIEQILLNLFGNALQAMQGQDKPGLVEVRLEAHTQVEARGDLRPGRYACLSVSDNGSGMDETTHAHIFEPFFTTKPRGKGTGLGLSVVHGMVQAHDASIEVESSPGSGSTFRIYFPATDAALQAIAAPSPEGVLVQGRGKQVLYVDDEQAIVSLMKRLLERQGYRVSGYTVPEEALAAVRDNPDQFDLAVTDYNMPGMSGLEVAQELKKIRSDLPVVMASGYITEELRAKAPAAGISELIYKPNTVDDLCEAVARVAQAVGDTPKSS